MRIDTHEDLVLKQYQDGIVLDKPSCHQHSSINSIKACYSLPHSFYFMNCNHEIVGINEVGVMLTGAQSQRDLIGDNLDKMLTQDFRKQTYANNDLVLRNERKLIVEENGDRIDDVEVKALSFKFPWYQQGKIVGIFGCAFIGNSLTELAYLISHLVSMGLLAQTPQISLTPSFNNANSQATQLTTRETEVLKHFLRGRTSKQIGLTLQISYRTVEHHLVNIRDKTGAKSRAELFDLFSNNQTSGFETLE